MLARARVQYWVHPLIQPIFGEATGEAAIRTSGIGYLAAVGGITGSLVALEWIRLGPATPTQFAYLGLLAIALVPIAILLVSTGVYLVGPPRPLPRARLTGWPRVALLYTAYNDAMPEAIDLTLRNLDYAGAEVWLLSDSTRPEAVALESTLPPSIRIFHRPTRRGGKPGAINDWLRVHGARFIYVVTMDADSILGLGSLRALVEIAEHPANRRYGGIQSLIEVHPAVAPTPFARILGRGVKWGSRIVPLAHQRLFGESMYWGHNALLRIDALRDVRGLVEDNICEDFAFTARLGAAGRPIALADVYTYEGFPPDALSLRERTVRWVRGNVSVAPSILRQPTGFPVRLGIATPLLFYLMAPTLLALLLLSFVAPPEVPSYRVGSLLGVSLLAFVFTYRLAVVPRTAASWRAFVVTAAAETVVILGMGLRVTWALLRSIGSRPTWTPSRKRAVHLSPAAAVRASLPELSFGGLLVGLVAATQPPAIYAALAAVWIISFLSTPLVLWLSGRPGGAGVKAVDALGVLANPQ